MGQFCSEAKAVPAGTFAALEEQCIYIDDPANGKMMWISDSGQPQFKIAHITRSGDKVKFYYDGPSGLQMPEGEH